MKLSWFIHPDATMRRAYAVGALCGLTFVWTFHLFI